MNRNTIEGTEEAVCEVCARIPVAHLVLDLEPPLDGWPAFFSERNIEVVEDDLGRPSVGREVLGALLAERQEEEARVATQRADLAAAREAPVPAGVPALDGASPYESMVAAGGVTTPQREFERRPAPNFLDEELAEGRRRDAERRAEAELLKHAQAVLEGRDK